MSQRHRFTILSTWIVLLACGCILLSGCRLGGGDDRRLEFTSNVRLDSSGTTVVTILVRNVSDRLYTDEEVIDGLGEVFNSPEQLLARFTQMPVERLVAGEEATIAVWRGTLEADRYFMRWSTPRHGGVELEFTLLKRFGVLEVGAYRERQIAPDPNAASPS